MPLEVHLRRRPWRNAAWTLLAAGVLIVLAWADHRGWFWFQGQDLARYEGKSFLVTRVLDGDTLEVDAPDGRHPATRVRLWGLDTPELARADRDSPAQPGAEEARQYTQQRAMGQRVRLKLEGPRPRDVYGRVLAFMELSDGQSLNEELLVAGLARLDTRWPHPYSDRYALLEQQARQSKAGLWSKASTPSAAAEKEPLE